MGQDDAPDDDSDAIQEWMTDEEKVARVRAIFEQARTPDPWNLPPPDEAKILAMRAAEREVQLALDTLITSANKWLDMDDGERTRERGWILGRYLPVMVDRVVKSLDIALESASQAMMMTLAVYPNLKAMLQDEDVAAMQWPDSLLKRRVDELEYYAINIRNDLGPIESILSAPPRLTDETPDAKMPAALIRFMEDRDEATYAEVAREVHGVERISGEAIRSNNNRANLILIQQGSAVRFRSRDRCRVVKEIGGC